jgi:hypothetical protein
MAKGKEEYMDQQWIRGIKQISTVQLEQAISKTFKELTGLDYVTDINPAIRKV